jgi:hypothetical protein
MEPEVFLSALADMAKLAHSLGVARTETVPFAQKRWYAEFERDRWGIKAANETTKLETVQPHARTMVG